MSGERDVKVNGVGKPQLASWARIKNYPPLPSRGLIDNNQALTLLPTMSRSSRETSFSGTVKSAPPILPRGTTENLCVRCWERCDGVSRLLTREWRGTMIRAQCVVVGIRCRVPAARLGGDDRKARRVNRLFPCKCYFSVFLGGGRGEEVYIKSRSV